MKKIGLLLLLALSFATTALAEVYDFTPGNRLKLIEDPIEGADLKIEMVKKAKHHIHIITFFLDDTSFPMRLADELQKANERGVEVRILSTLVPTIGMDFLGKGRRKLKSNNKAVFTYQLLSPEFKFSLTHNLHEKLFVVDGQEAIIGGRNISDSSFNGKDLEVLIEGPAVNQVQHHFKKMFDFVIEQKKRMKCEFNDEYNSGFKERCVESFDSLNFSRNIQYFPEQPVYEDGSEARILSHEAIIHQYENSLSRKKRLEQRDDILDTLIKIPFKKLRAYNYFMLQTERYRTYLEKNLAEGNEVEMITNGLESAKFSSNRGYIYSLPESHNMVSKGMKMYQWQKNQQLNYVHEKVMIFDDNHVLIGSHNFGTGSTSVSNEIAIEIKSEAMAKRLIEVFEREKSDSKITKEVDSEFLQKEIDQHQRQIRIYRNTILGSILREIY